MRPDESLGYWLTQTMRSVANAFSDVLQTACATLGKPYMITPPQWFALSSLASAATTFNQRLLQGFSQEEREMLLQQFARIRANALSTQGETPHPDASSELVPRAIYHLLESELEDYQ